MTINILIFFLLGLSVGSFINVLIYRFKNGISLKGRSFCPFCRKEIKIRDLVPLLSFILLKGRCRYCQKKITGDYFIVELVTGLLFVFIFLSQPILNLLLLRNLFFISILIFVFFFDLKYYLIADKIVLPAVIIALLMNLFLGYQLKDLFFGILIGSSFFFLQYVLSRGKALGLGDAKLGLLIGAMLGWPLTVLTIFLAYLIGGSVAVILLISGKKKMGDKMPMGTFLALAAVISLLWGEIMIGCYYR